MFGTSHEGVMHFRGGEIAHLMILRQPSCGESDDGCISIRYESGWYTPYREDGTRIASGCILSPDGSSRIVVGSNNRDVVRFEPISLEEAKAKYPGISSEIHP